MTSNVDLPRQRWWLLALTLFTFFFLLGGRSLNEPDEGRYAEIAREMIELNDWLVPHLWYVPHLDKPPLTYWAVAVSISVFGQNEWAVRLPLALAGISGVWVTYLFGLALGGARVGIWSVLILQSSLLYFVMARMLTTDIFLTQFIAWTVYFFWRSWRCLDAEASEQGSERNLRTKRFFAWHLASWTTAALGFLTKGPVALVIPLAAVSALVIYRQRDGARRRMLLLGMVPGLVLFGVCVAPWFCMVFKRLPMASQFMIFGQVIGHALGTAIKNRTGHPLYYFAILGVGFLPWTLLLGWLWRGAHWRRLNTAQKEGWTMLSVWVLLNFIFFSLTRSKLPAYILPLFPALAVMAALRFFTPGPDSDAPQPPGWAWRVCMTSPLTLMVAVPVAALCLFRIDEPLGLTVQAAIGLVALGILGWLGLKFSALQCAAVAVVVGLLNLQVIAASAPAVETVLKRNQTLKPLGLALKQAWRPDVMLVCWGRLPQGLPFYAHPAISAANRPYLGGMALDQVPFEFPGNRERFGDRLVPDEEAMIRLLSGNRSVLVVGVSGSLNHFQSRLEHTPLALVARVGQWELFSNP
jgi:4-amino-4-deoxy-L-arabinose transferase-like glycosyltransferase